MTALPDNMPAASLPAHLRRAGRSAGFCGLIGLSLCAVVWIAAMLLGAKWPSLGPAFYKAYLVAWLFFTGISLGSMAGVMVHNLTGGQWGWFIRRPAEAAANVLPMLAVLFLPMLAG